MHTRVRHAKKHHFILNTKFIPDINVPYNKKEPMQCILTIRILHRHSLYYIYNPLNPTNASRSSSSAIPLQDRTHLPMRIVLITKRH